MATMATATDNAVAPTGNDFLDTLIWGDKWNDDHPVTFFFDDGTTSDDVWTEVEKDAIRNALDIYEEYIALQFEEVNDAGDANFVLVLSNEDDIGGAAGKFEDPDEATDQALGQFRYTWNRWTPLHLQVGGYAFETVVHEFGHGLGLGHPHGTTGLNGQPFAGVDDSGDPGDDGQNSGIYTVMSYLDHSQFWAPVPATSDLGWGYVASPMGLDIAALQHIYGANPTNNGGHSTYTLPTVEGDGTYWKAIWDTGGNDIIRNPGSGPSTIDLRPAPLTGPDAGGYLSRVNDVAGGFTIAHGVTIEYAEGGSGDDDIIGNGADNELAGGGGNDGILGNGGDDLLDGGAGDDDLNGGTGDDTMDGGAGNDGFFVDSLLDELHEKAGGGIDTVITSITYTLANHFENLQLAETGGNAIDGYGNAADNQIIGNAGPNTLEGRGGNDFVNAGNGRDMVDGGTGKDTIYGGNGDDVLDGGADDDAVALMAAAPGGLRGGTQPDPERGIGAFLEDERAARTTAGHADWLHGGNGQDTVSGRGGDDMLYGDGGDDRLVGGNGADWLDGGSGRDTMIGEAGNDIYVVDSAFDAVSEAAGQGIDGVFSLVDYTLGANVENLTLTGWAGNHTSGKGNGLANWITGNGGSNVIAGLGGDDLLMGMGGNDFLDGGTGVDMIFGGDGNDVIDGGADAVLGGGPVILAPGGGFGDGLAGGNGADTVYGRGGADTIHGDDGDDELYGEGGNDSISGGHGADTLDGGAGADSLRGDELGDSLSGGSGNDSLNGGVGADTMNGGTGDDLMIGGGGDDVFIVDAPGDLVLEGLELGTDGVLSSISHTLAANVENLVLVASAVPGIAGTGNELANQILGNADGNLIDGLAGDDALAGAAGADEILGGDGADTLFGGEDGDTLDGGAGDDVLEGGDGGDRFDFSGAFGADTIAGFDPGQGDRLSIAGFGTDLDNFDELAAWIDQNGGDTVIDLTALGGGTILIQGYVGLQADDVDLLA
ncbi:MAG: hypothetical protein AB7O45_08840 [Alphaproteobacteria bacterium]